MPEPLTLEQSAALVAGYAGLEQRLYELLGAWAASDPVPAAAVLFDGQSQEHAWHAELWTERVPLVPGLAVAPGEDGAGHALLDAVAAVQGTAHRLAALARLTLPRVVAGYRRHLAAAAEATDGPVMRALRLALADDVEALLGAEGLLQTLPDAAGAAGAVAGRLAALESALSGPGLTGWPAVPAPGPV